MRCLAGNPMSVDFYFLPKSLVGLDPEKAKLFVEAEDRNWSVIPAAIDANVERSKRAFADDLLRLQPTFSEALINNFEGIARLEKIGVDEARRKWRHIEINGPGIQFIIHDRHVFVGRYFGLNSEELDALFAALSGGRDFVVYDPQRFRVFDLTEESMLDD
jgi:hypothetical protein